MPECRLFQETDKIQAVLALHLLEIAHAILVRVVSLELLEAAGASVATDPDITIGPRRLVPVARVLPGLASRRAQLLGFFAAIGQGLGEVVSADGCRTVEVGDGPGKFQNAVEAARGKRQALGGLAQ